MQQICLKLLRDNSIQMLRKLPESYKLFIIMHTEIGLHQFFTD